MTQISKNAVLTYNALPNAIRLSRLLLGSFVLATTFTILLAAGFALPLLTRLSPPLQTLAIILMWLIDPLVMFFSVIVFASVIRNPDKAARRKCVACIAMAAVLLALSLVSVATETPLLMFLSPHLDAINIPWQVARINLLITMLLGLALTGAAFLFLRYIARQTRRPWIFRLAMLSCGISAIPSVCFITSEVTRTFPQVSGWTFYTPYSIAPKPGLIIYLLNYITPVANYAGLIAQSIFWTLLTLIVFPMARAQR